MSDLIRLLLPFGLMLILFYFMLFLPEKKRKQKFEKMLSELRLNDQIVTRGGILGKLIKIEDDNVTLETGQDRVKIKIQKTAVVNVLNAEV